MATILIADDDAASRLLLTTLLTHSGHIVLQAASGRDAVDAVERERPDLLVTDLSMPELSGAEVIRALRNQGNRVRIALYTATAESAALRDFMNMYAVCALIPKPSEPEAIIEGVRSALA